MKRVVLSSIFVNTFNVWLNKSWILTFMNECFQSVTVSQRGVLEKFTQEQNKWGQANDSTLLCCHKSKADRWPPWRTPGTLRSLPTPGGLRVVCAGPAVEALLWTALATSSPLLLSAYTRPSLRNTQRWWLWTGWWDWLFHMKAFLSEVECLYPKLLKFRVYRFLTPAWHNRRKVPLR